MSNEESSTPQVEPWLRGTHAELDSIRRQIVHALELAAEDAERWCAPLTVEQQNRSVYAVATVAYHLRHIARSLDRLLTYAQGNQLHPAQRAALADELTQQTDAMPELREGLRIATRRVRAFDPATFCQQRGVGRDQLPGTVGGLLVHCAEHTQRHIGQAITTAQIVSRMPVDDWVPRS